jgi:hypothetical protein
MSMRPAIFFLFSFFVLSACTWHNCDDAGTYKGNCIYFEAADLKSVSNCDSLDERYQPLCYAGFAAGHKDPAMCDVMKWKFSDDKADEFIVKCYLETVSGPNACDKVQQDKQNLCYYDLAMYQNSCEGVPEQYLIDCSKGLTRVVGSTIDDCRNITDKQLQEGCISSIAKTEKNVTLCEQAGYYRDACISSIGMQTRDSSLCSSVNKSSERATCDLFFQVLADQSRCTSASNPDCLKFIGTIYGSKACMALNGDDADWCLVSAAISGRDLTVCDEIKNVELKYMCLSELSDIIRFNLTTYG